MIIRKSRRELERMAAAGSIVARTLDMLRREASAGVTTGDLDRLAEDFIRAEGGIPTFKGYHGFTGSICSSPNDMIVHGIPGPYELRDGDVISLDVGVTFRGWVADSAITVAVGEVAGDARRLLETCRQSLFDAIETCRPGAHLSDIGHAVQTRVEGEGFGVVRALVGHGVGRRMHEDPQVPNYRVRTRGPKIAAGLCVAVEPMLTAGSAVTRTLEDGWTVVTTDGGRAAHWEHSVAVTPKGPWVLTALDGGVSGLATIDALAGAPSEYIRETA
jgi:methionyl aminopeptidase